MPHGKIVAEHPYFGPVTARASRVLFEPPTGRSGVEYSARSVLPQSGEDAYAGAGARLAAFETFCRNLDAHDARVRAHFATWPSSAGAFELIGVAAALQGNLAIGLDRDESALPSRPFGLEYHALDEDAWAFADVSFWPGTFFALFDESGGFVGVHDEVERGMRRLPAVLPRSRWTEGWHHTFFGRHPLSDYCEIATARVADDDIEINLIMDRKAMCAFEPEQLDPFASLVARMSELDAIVRADFPEEARAFWLHDSYDAANAYMHPALHELFAPAKGPDGVSPEAFSAALKLKSAFVSLGTKEGPKLVMDYQILPDLEDDVFAASFAPDGRLVDVTYEG